MQYLPYLLCMLACPIGMGMMLWMAMRSGKEQTRPDENAEARVAARSALPGSPSQAFSPLKMIVDCVKMCLNWKVVGVLVLVALVIAIVAPQWLWGAIPLLLVAACPLSMLVMLFSMHASHTSQRHGTEIPGCVSCETQQPSPTWMGKPVEHAQEAEEPVASGVRKRVNRSHSLPSL